MEFINFLLRISWKHITIASTAGLVCGASNALLMSLINREVHQGHIYKGLLYFAVLACFILVTSILSQFMLIYLTQNAIYELRLKLSENILSSPLEHLERLKENRLIVTFTEDVHTLTHAVSAIPSITVDCATVIGCFVYLALVSNALFVLTVASTVSAIWFVQTILNKAESLFFKAREQEDTLIKHFQSIITGIKELKLNRSRRQEFMQKKLKTTAKQLKEKNNKAMKSFALANGFGQMSQFFTLGFILFILPMFLELPLSILASYVLIGTFIALPMQNLLNRIPELIRGNVALGKIQRMKLALSRFSEFNDIDSEIMNSCQVQFQGVTYRYLPDLPLEEFEKGEPPFPPDNLPPEFREGKPPFPPDNLSPDFKEGNDHWNQQPGNLPFPPFDQNAHHRFTHPFMPDEKGFLLGPINLSLKPGELVFIIGGNGSGKSTLAKLITGLYPAQSGKIYLNDQQITANNLEWYRQHFSAIFSDFHLFDTYLGFNDIHIDQKIEYYLKKMHLDHKVEVKNGILSTTNLSQGQRKRLALLTIYLEDRPIYVFDEWAADQEPNFRELFYRQILFQLKQRGKIVIVITHDDRYFDLADHLIKLHYGQIEFDRTFKEKVEGTSIN